MLTMTPIIVGWNSHYVGSAYPQIADCRVRIVCVRKTLHPPEESLKITSNEELAGLGGLSEQDRVDVSPVLQNGRTGTAVFADVALQDLACYPVILAPWVPGSHEG